MLSQQTITSQLLALLWQNYGERVSYAREYVRLVTEKGGTVVNDHCAFRTFHAGTGQQTPGFESIGYLLECLGYQKVSPYAFPSKHLNSWHYQHPTERLFPKFFVTQLEVGELPENVQEMINESVADAADLLSPEIRGRLEELKANGALPADRAEGLAEALSGFFARPWSPPRREVVLAVNEVSQFAAWTLLHGNSVNHFTAYINYQNVPEWPDMEATVAGLAAAGVPMKSHIEGEPGSKLRQSSTQAVDEPCTVIEADGSIGTLDWSYAYYELAERGEYQGNWFEGFLGEQATNLFEMTKRD